MSTSHAQVALVAVKHVPVADSGLRIDGNELTRQGLAHNIDPINEVALEWALQAREAGTVDRVVAVTMGPQDAVDTLRKALAMGADEAVHLTDPRLRSADVRTTARALVGVAARVDASLVLCGFESMDGSSGVVPATVAALLGWPVLSRLSQGTLNGGTLRGERDLGSGPEVVEVSLPAVVSCVEGQIAPRYPKLKDMLRTKSVVPLVLSADDIGLGAATAWASGSVVDVPQVAKSVRVVDLAEGVEEILSLLTSEVHRG